VHARTGARIEFQQSPSGAVRGTERARTMIDIKLGVDHAGDKWYYRFRQKANNGVRGGDAHEAFRFSTPFTSRAYVGTFGACVFLERRVDDGLGISAETPARQLVGGEQEDGGRS